MGYISQYQGQEIDDILEASEEHLNKNIFDLIYPIGSIYMSASSINPQVLFSGQWQQIQDTFLLACGSAYSAGSNGGSKEHKHTTQGHTLTTAEIPSHKHDAPQGDTSKDDYVFSVSRQNGLSTTGRRQLATSSSSGIYTNTLNINASDSIGSNDMQAGSSQKSTKSTGSGASHTHGDTGTTSNLPPYLAVYVWQRIS